MYVLENKPDIQNTAASAPSVTGYSFVCGDLDHFLGQCGFLLDFPKAALFINLEDFRSQVFLRNLLGSTLDQFRIKTLFLGSNRLLLLQKNFIS